MSARMTLLVSALVASAAGLAGAASPEVSIPFVGMGSINDWRADKNHGLWIQDDRRRWYYATIMGTCLDLDTALTIAFETHPAGTLDRFSTIVVRREGRCHLNSLIRSNPPPKKARPAPRDKT